jgi:drug/metabolite transporter (DMT)-like permease
LILRDSRGNFPGVQTGLGIFLLFVTALGWAGAWITARLAAGALPPLTVTWGRFLVASVALLPAWWMLDRGARVRLVRSDLVMIAGMALTGIVGYTILFMMGIAKAPASDGAVIVPGLAGVFALTPGAVTTRRVPPPRALLASAPVVAGIVLPGLRGRVAP